MGKDLLVELRIKFLHSFIVKNQITVLYLNIYLYYSLYHLTIYVFETKIKFSKPTFLDTLKFSKTTLN